MCPSRGADFNGRFAGTGTNLVKEPGTQDLPTAFPQKLSVVRSVPSSESVGGSALFLGSMHSTLPLLLLLLPLLVERSAEPGKLW